MAIFYSQDVKTKRMQVVLDAIDASPEPGAMEFTTENSAIVLRVPLRRPAGVVTGSLLQLSPRRSSTTSPEAVRLTGARVVNGAGETIIIGLTCGPKGSRANVQIPTSLKAGERIAIEEIWFEHG